MRPHDLAPRARRIAVLALACLVVFALATSGCKSRNAPIVVNNDTAVDSTGTVQASDTVEVTSSPQPAESSVPTVVIIPADGQVPEAPPTGPKGFWPDKVGSFATRFAKPVWYPKTLPKGYKVDSLDVVELEPGAGLVCDIVYINGDKTLQFTQGSPVSRDYEIVSAGKTPWGNKTADVVHEDPEDPTSPIAIVLVDGGSLLELYGDATAAELKAVAASMTPVK